MRKEDAVIGTRVIAVTEVDGMPKTFGKEGTIICNSETDMYDICVEFDDYIDELHDGAGSGAWGHCWWGKFEDFELLSDDSVEIKLSFDELLGG